MTAELDPDTIFIRYVGTVEGEAELTALLTDEGADVSYRVTEGWQEVVEHAAEDITATLIVTGLRGVARRIIPVARARRARPPEVSATGYNRGDLWRCVPRRRRPRRSASAMRDSRLWWDRAQRRASAVTHL